MDLPRKRIERVLVVHTAFLGDIILATPFLSALRKIFPEAEILFLTNAAGAALLQPNPWNIQTEIFHKRGKDSGPIGLWRKIKKLKKFQPQITFCLHRSLRSALLARGVGAPVWGFAEAAGSFLFSHKVKRDGFEYEAQKNLALLFEYLGSQNEGADLSPYPKLIWNKEEEKEGAALVKGMGSYIVIAPSSVWATKRWPAERYAELALEFVRKKGLPAVIVGGNESMDKVLAHKVREKFLKLCSPSERALAPIDLSGKTNLGVLKYILSQAKLAISNDSAPLHMAIAVGTPVHGVFGPTTKELGFFPLAPEGKSSVSEVENLSCRPCGLHGHKVCPLGHFKCMLDLTVEQVFSECP